MAGTHFSGRKWVLKQDLQSWDKEPPPRAGTISTNQGWADHQSETSINRNRPIYIRKWGEEEERNTNVERNNRIYKKRNSMYVCVCVFSSIFFHYTPVRGSVKSKQSQKEDKWVSDSKQLADGPTRNWIGGPPCFQLFVCLFTKCKVLSRPRRSQIIKWNHGCLCKYEALQDKMKKKKKNAPFKQWV